MSIRPSYGRRSVLQVLSDGMSQRPPTGKSCCEEAALNAAEVDRLTRERDTLQRCVDSWAARAEKAEAERDELQAKLDAAEQRPTLDREAVEDILYPRLNTGRFVDPEETVDNILALAPKVPSWLGDVPDKPEVKLGAQTATVGGNTYNVYNHTAKGLRAEAWRNLALADAMDAEEAEQGAEDQRVEELAKALHYGTHQGRSYVPWDLLDEYEKDDTRAAIRAGWVKEGQ